MLLFSYLVVAVVVFLEPNEIENQCYFGDVFLAICRFNVSTKWK